MTLLTPLRTAVVVVHLQNDFVGVDGAVAAPFRGEIVRRDVLVNANRITVAARSAGAKVVYLRIAFQPGHPDLVANAPLFKNILRDNLHVEGTSGAAIADEVEPLSDDTVVTHQRLNGFQGTQLDVLLRGAGVDALVFCGIATNMAVEGAARAAADLGYRTLVVEDACSTFTEALHNGAIASLGALAEIISTADLIEALELASERTGQ
ncbi:cysteine hydrolase [Nocardia sp. CA2R105]|uniref:cysteine hydrolase family protein n=1 Tax=Nocardia coffeae TaxID=2873381 RepID=UPI001CA72E47|nr:isochorismatase family cysteine hydrolase [Nocardia coffeae]MBY8863446.1 cysteine hydrolase [Nocardia coffeae]